MRAIAHQFKITSVTLALLAGATAGMAATAADDLAAVAKKWLGTQFIGDWRGIEKLPHLRWAPLPPNMPVNCLSDGSCFTRQGTASFGTRRWSVLATGARMSVGNLYFRNHGAPIGTKSVLQALAHDGFATTLARCPVPGSGGTTNWYRLSSAATNAAYLAVQTSCGGHACEDFALSYGDALPPLQPYQLRLYSEDCASGSERRPISTVLPYQLLARTLIGLLPAAGAPANYDWKSLRAQAPKVEWPGGGPTKMNLSYRNDPNPLGLSGRLLLPGREYHVLASGTRSQVLTVGFDEGGLHPRGEDVLGLLRAHGLAVQLVRCGPVYTKSSVNWYRISGPNVRPVVLRQSLRFDGAQTQGSYELRLDASLPAPDARGRDRNPGVGGCR